MKINIKATNAKLTAESHEVINDKISSLSKYFGNIIHAHIEVGINSLHHNKGNIYKVVGSLSVPKKILTASSETDNITKSINEVRSKLKAKLIKYKGTHKE
jgi:ribosomal subunit interface protein